MFIARRCCAMEHTNYDGLSDTLKLLLDAAAKARETAYNPYSHFYVGAALRTWDNEIFTGSNVENSAYGATICAERAAIVSANARGNKLYKSIAIIARREDNGPTGVVSPCGTCRQVLFEASQVSEVDLEVIMSNEDKSEIIISTINELLPLGFGPKNIGKDADIRKYQRESYLDIPLVQVL